MIRDRNASWLTVAPSDELSKIARRFSADRNSPFPIPVDEFLADLADVHEDEWDSDCDALTVGLQSSRPTVYIKAGAFGPRRSFTIAHEIGHIVIPWHTGAEAGCDIDTLIDHPVNRDTRFPVLRQEQEAQFFAGALLLPYEVVYEQFASLPISAALMQLSKAGISAPAFAIRMAKCLLPGFLFYVEKSRNSSSFAVTSLGSNLASISIENAADRAEESGALEVSGKTVRWFRFLRDSKIPDVSDSRKTSELLRSAILAAGIVDEVRKQNVFNRLNGIVAGKLSAHRTDSPDAMLSILKHRFEFVSADLQQVVNSHDFELYLWRKASERANKLARQHG